MAATAAVRRWMRRLRYWLSSASRAQLLREEMESHLEMRAQELMESGMAENDARNEARREFGSPSRHQEESRQIWIARWMTDFAQDAAYALRSFRTQRGFSAAAVLSTALGIGACSLIFAVANSALLRPLPARNPSRLQSITGRNLVSGKVGQHLSFPDIEDLRRARSFQGIAAFVLPVAASIEVGGAPQRYWGSLVTENYFDVVQPSFAVGRGFEAFPDDKPVAPPGVVLSHRLWQSRFGSDPAISGRNILLNNVPVTVLGVTAPRFQGTETVFASDFWAPISMSGNFPGLGIDRNRMLDRGGQWLSAVGRLREGSSEASAASEIGALGESLRAAFPSSNRNRGFHVERAGQLNPGLRKLFLLFFMLSLGIALLVLCTACANVANLLLARAAARRKEIGVRLALGAGRARLVRQLLTESILLGLTGGAGGLLVAHLGAIGLGKIRLPLSLPVEFSVSLDVRVVLFCAALSIFTGLLFGLVPALRATKPDLSEALKDERRTAGRSRSLELRNMLVVAQVSICTVLLVCSGLFLRSLQHASNLDTGLSNRNLLLVPLDTGTRPDSVPLSGGMVDSILDSTHAIPGVRSACLTTALPLSLTGVQNAFVPEGTEADSNLKGMTADIYTVTPGFFETFGIPLVAGEGFRPGESTKDVAIVNRALVDRAYAGGNPVGRRIHYQGRILRVIGIAATAKSRTIGEDPRPCLYLPLAGALRGEDLINGLTFVVRTSGSPSRYGPQVRRAIRDVAPSVAASDIQTMDAHLQQALFLPRTTAGLFGLAGLAGLLISVIGLYGVVSYRVARRTREIGIRLALGARRVQVIGMVVRQGLMLTLIGGALGLSAALALGRVVGSLLYGVTPTDTITLLGAPALLMGVAAAACLGPARRAAALDPVRSVRCE